MYVDAVICYPDSPSGRRGVFPTLASLGTASTEERQLGQRLSPPESHLTVSHASPRKKFQWDTGEGNKTCMKQAKEGV